MPLLMGLGFLCPSWDPCDQAVEVLLSCKITNNQSTRMHNQSFFFFFKEIASSRRRTFLGGRAALGLRCHVGFL